VAAGAAGLWGLSQARRIERSADAGEPAPVLAPRPVEIPDLEGRVPA